MVNFMLCISPTQFLKSNPLKNKSLTLVMHLGFEDTMVNSTDKFPAPMHSRKEGEKKNPVNK